MKKLRFLIFLMLSILICSASVLAEEFNKSWTGAWSREGSSFHEATMKISYNTENSFLFEIDALFGVRSGNVSGIALIKDNSAIFDDGKGFILKFNLENNKIIIEQKSYSPYELSAGYGGAGVFFNGTYAQGNVTFKNWTLVDYEVLTPYQEELFKEMTGKYYSIFTSILHSRRSREDLDGFGSKVSEFCVKGLCDIMNCIIMVANDNKMWAATLDVIEIHYFTNTNQTQTLPLTIESWRVGFKDKPVIYQSVPQK